MGQSPGFSTHLIPQAQKAGIANAGAARLPLDFLGLLGADLDLGAWAHPAASDGAGEILTTKVAARLLVFAEVLLWWNGLGDHTRVPYYGSPLAPRKRFHAVTRALRPAISMEGSTPAPQSRRPSSACNWT